ncbi:MAG: hypothetical protein SGPRY_008633 [Prymnesium sp.]
MEQKLVAKAAEHISTFHGGRQERQRRACKRKDAVEYKEIAAMPRANPLAAAQKHEQAQGEAGAVGETVARRYGKQGKKRTVGADGAAVRQQRDRSDADSVATKAGSRDEEGVAKQPPSKARKQQSAFDRSDDETNATSKARKQQSAVLSSDEEYATSNVRKQQSAVDRSASKVRRKLSSVDNVSDEARVSEGYSNSSHRTVSAEESAGAADADTEFKSSGAVATTALGLRLPGQGERGVRPELEGSDGHGEQQRLAERGSDCEWTPEREEDAILVDNSNSDEGERSWPRLSDSRLFPCATVLPVFAFCLIALLWSDDRLMVE